MFFAKKLLYYQNQFPKIFTTPGTYQIVLPAGTYQVVARGAGGSGGNTARARAVAGGVGGAGAPGQLKDYTVSFNTATLLSVYVGEGGKLYDQGGNGGAAGYQWSESDLGHGGGGGMPSYLKRSNGECFAGAQGGGGGGGGGGNTNQGRYSGGGGGGGGGGFYYLESTGVTNYPGKAGGNGGTSGAGASAGVAGYNFDTSVTSGRGGTSNHGGGAAATGTGASGGGGGYGSGNESGARGGTGGGGAGGSAQAGGGDAGYNNATGGVRGTAASNHYTTPIDTTADNATYGITGNYGQGGAPNQNGQGGFVIIRRV